MRYTLCLFDLDGTLTDPKIGITKSFQYALSYFGIHEELDNLTNLSVLRCGNPSKTVTDFPIPIQKKP